MGVAAARPRAALSQCSWQPMMNEFASLHWDSARECVMTSAQHASGTDRIAEVVRSRGYGAEDIVVNLQGDEPMMPAEVIARVAGALRETASADMATAVAPIESLQEFLDPNCVKALRAADGRALYFSRAPVPWPRDSVAADLPTRFAGAWRHIGIYAYRVRSSAAVRGLGADAARDDREAGAVARFGAWHAHPSSDTGRSAAGRRGYASGPGTRSSHAAQRLDLGPHSPMDLRRKASLLRSISARTPESSR